MRIRTGTTRRAAAAVATLALVLSVAACSDDDDSGSDPEPEPGPSEVPASVESQVEVGEVAGRLPRSKRQGIKEDAGQVVVTWLEAAYFAGSPRPKLDAAFPGFTEDATRLARRDSWLLSNASLAEGVEEVVPVRPMKVRLDILAPKGRVAGVTARFRVVFDAVAGQTRRVTVSGRVVLTRNSRGNWKIFGYDAARWSQAPKGGKS